MLTGVERIDHVLPAVQSLTRQQWRCIISLWYLHAIKSAVDTACHGPTSQHWASLCMAPSTAHRLS